MPHLEYRPVLYDWLYSKPYCRATSNCCVLRHLCVTAPRGWCQTPPAIRLYRTLCYLRCSPVAACHWVMLWWCSNRSSTDRCMHTIFDRRCCFRRYCLASRCPDVVCTADIQGPSRPTVESRGERGVGDGHAVCEKLKWSHKYPKTSSDLLFSLKSKQLNWQIIAKKSFYFFAVKSLNPSQFDR